MAERTDAYTIILYAILGGVVFSVVVAAVFIWTGGSEQTAAFDSLHAILGDVLKAALTFTLIAVGGGYIKILGDNSLEKQRQRQARTKELEDRRRSIIDGLVEINSGFYGIRKRLEAGLRPNKKEYWHTWLAESIDLEGQFGTLKILAIQLFKLPSGALGRKWKDVLERELKAAEDSKVKARLRLDLLGEYYDEWRHTLDRREGWIKPDTRDAVWKHFEALLRFFEEFPLEGPLEDDKGA
jgi:hypothetical protein